jgi:hypothetical protein
MSSHSFSVHLLACAKGIAPSLIQKLEVLFSAPSPLQTLQLTVSLDSEVVHENVKT